jgi:hypothetical protein
LKKLADRKKMMRNALFAILVCVAIGLTGWFAYNLAVMRWERDPVRVASSFAREFEDSLPLEGLQWSVVVVTNKFPGVTISLTTQSNQAEIEIRLRSFLGLGWHTMFFETTEK